MSRFFPNRQCEIRQLLRGVVFPSSDAVQYRSLPFGGAHGNCYVNSLDRWAMNKGCLTSHGTDPGPMAIADLGIRACDGAQASRLVQSSKP